MKKAIVIGSGAGGAMIAKELQGHFQVTLLEAGQEFKPFTYKINQLATLRKSGIFLDERMITLLFPAMKIIKSSDIVMVYGSCIGGTTTLSTGSALRYDEKLKQLGINLNQEFKELSEEIPLSIEHTNFWSANTKKLFSICQQLDLNPTPTTKFIDFNQCIRCGQCVLGCQTGAKWDSRQLVLDSIQNGAVLKTNCKVEKLGIDKNKNIVDSVYVKEGGRQKKYNADLIILSARGLGTPKILNNSGIQCKATLFVDPVFCVAAPYSNFRQNYEIPMPFLMQRDGYMLSPYMDFLSLFFNKSWRLAPHDIVSIMIKLSDSSLGSSFNHKLEKNLTITDKKRLEAGVNDCKNILKELGIYEQDIFFGTLNAGHPGGSFPLTKEESKSLHSSLLPKNLYVSDASLLPESMGNPPIWTLLELSKCIAKKCISSFV